MSVPTAAATPPAAPTGALVDPGAGSEPVQQPLGKIAALLIFLGIVVAAGLGLATFVAVSWLPRLAAGGGSGESSEEGLPEIEEPGFSVERRLRWWPRSEGWTAATDDIRGERDPWPGMVAPHVVLSSDVRLAEVTAWKATLPPSARRKHREVTPTISLRRTTGDVG